MTLSDAALRSMKPGPRPRRIADGGGLYIEVATTGVRLWRLAYRFDGKQRTLAIGPYPSVTLASAREAREAAKRQLRAGVDPSAQKRLEKIAAAANRAATFSVVAEELLVKKAAEGKAERTLEKSRWLFGLAKPFIGDRPIAEITPPEVLAALRAVEVKGLHETAVRLRSHIGAVIRYAIATGGATSDPTLALRGALIAPTVTHRAAITDPMAFGALLRAIDGFQGQPTTRAALELMALLFPRPGELRAAEWPEFDLDKAVWAIPAARTKMRRPHLVPLPRQAVGILRELHALTGRSRLVFPGYGMSGGKGRVVAPKPISENTLNGALRRLGYGSEEASAHGFRATASTLLNESGKFSPDAIERALAHKDPDAVRRAYARGAFWDERVAMMTWWADELDRLRARAQRS